MPDSHKLLAWVEGRSNDAVLAAFVSAAARGRAPATQLCSSHAAARRWVEEQAAEFRAPVEWVSAAPRSS